MFATASAIGLSAVFCVIVGYCAWNWVGRRTATGAVTTAQRVPDQVVDLNQIIMGIVMLVMVWWPSGQLGIWVQSGIFGVLLVLQVSLVRASATAPIRIDHVSHAVLNLAMIWMLLAMPLLMGGSSAAGEGAHAEHQGGSDSAGAASFTEIPGWVAPVNMIIIGISIGVTLWFLVRAVRAPAGHRVHDLCHALCGGAMASMLALM